jgi:hypothetical protein
MILANRKIFTSNIIIGTAIALFVSFLMQTTLLRMTLGYLLKTLLLLDFALVTNRAYYAPSVPGLAIDALVIVIAAYLWTYQRTTQHKIISLLALAVALVPVTFFFFYRYGVLLSSLLIVVGITCWIAAEAALELFSNRFRRKIVTEKQDAEYNIVRHLNHNLKPAIQMVRSPIDSVIDFLEKRDLLGETVARRLDGSDETVGEALRNAVVSLRQIGDILDGTRMLVTHEISRDDFRDENLRELFLAEIVPLFAQRVSISVECGPEVRIRLHRHSFVEAMHNIIRNAEVHGCRGDGRSVELIFRVTERRRNIFIDYTNNGRPFPANLTARDFLSFGRKSNDSPGEGLGGAWVGKVLEAHGGSFEIIRDECPVHFRITLPRRGI